MFGERSAVREAGACRATYRADNTRSVSLTEGTRCALKTFWVVSKNRQQGPLQYLRLLFSGFFSSCGVRKGTGSQLKRTGG